MEKPSTARIALKWGLISAICSIIYTTILYFTGMWKTSAFAWIGYIFLAGGIIMAMREFKSQNNDYMSYGEGLGIGSLLSAVSGVISAIYGYIYMNFIDNTMTQQIIEMQSTKMAEQGMTEEQIDQAMQMAGKFMTPGMMFIFTVLGMLFFGFILSLIISAIMRKNKPEMDF
jgi:Protein of unknown function (DUF4199)